MPREDGSPPLAGADEAAPAQSTDPSIALLEQLTALANRALEAMRAGDMEAVNALLAEREPFLARLASAISRNPAPDAHVSTLAQRDADALAELEREIARARIEVAGQLDAVTSAQASIARYSCDAPPGPRPSSIDIRR